MNTLITSIAVVALGALCLPAQAQQAPAAKTAAMAASAPGTGTIARAVSVSAHVEAIDTATVNAKTQTLTLKGPKRTVDLKVPDTQQFKLVKVGDQIHAVYTEAVALSVEPAKK